jgi:hypothetical protein
MASPGARKGHAGKWGELTPWRQRGGRGMTPLPYPLCVCVEAQDAYNNVVTQGYLVFNRVVPRVFSSSRGPGLMRKPGKGR